MDTTILNGVEARRPTAVIFRGRLSYEGPEVGVAVRASFAIHKCVVERGEELEPPLDSGVMVPLYAYAF